MNIARTILFYLLCILVGFFLGLFIAKMVDAGKDQMLAGGAIVLGYGIIGLGIGLVLAFLMTVIIRTKSSHVILINKVLSASLLLLWLFFYLQYRNREAEKKALQQNEQIGLRVDQESKFPKSKCRDLSPHQL